MRRIAHDTLGLCPEQVRNEYAANRKSEPVAVERYAYFSIEA